MNRGIRRHFEIVIQIIIAVSLVAFSVETVPDISDDLRVALEWFECFSIGVFILEYCLRLWFSENRWRFVFSFFGAVDLLAILPFFLSTSVDLRSVRAIRLLRLIRILKLVRYNAALHRFHVALSLAKEEIILFAALAAIVLFLSAVGIYHFENEAQPEQFRSVFHSLWWAITTLTTVGYGDVVPVTVGGRCFTFLVLLVGLGIVSIPAGLVSASLLQARSLESGSSSIISSEVQDVNF